MCEVAKEKLAGTYIGNGDGFVRFTQVFKHVLDEDRTLRDIALCKSRTKKLVHASGV